MKLTCGHCKEPLEIFREQVKMITDNTIYEVTQEENGHFSFKEVTSYRENGSLENEEFVCNNCREYIDDNILDKLLEQYP